MKVARHRLNPGISHANQRLPQILVGEANGFEHSAGGRAVATLRDQTAAVFGIHRVFQRQDDNRVKAIREKGYQRVMTGARP